MEQTELMIIETKDKEQDTPVNLFDPKNVDFTSKHILPEKTVKLKPISEYAAAKNKKAKKELNKKYPNRKNKHNVEKFKFKEFNY